MRVFFLARRPFSAAGLYLRCEKQFNPHSGMVEAGEKRFTGSFLGLFSARRSRGVPFAAQSQTDTHP
jgi:hypothetical protein